MIKKSIDLNLYQDWYKEMESALAQMGTTWDDQPDYSREIGLVRDNIQKLPTSYAAEFDNLNEEALYHRVVWPRFYGKLFFYLLVQRFCYQRNILPSGKWRALMSTEENRISRFFTRHRRFWADYLYGASHFSEQFTRPYSRYLILDPLSILLDAAGATVAGYRVAWGLAYQEYRGWLRMIEDNPRVPVGSVYEWRETKSAAAELIKSQAEAGSVFINGKPATAAQLRSDFEVHYHVDLKDFDNLLYAMDTLKLEDTPYLSKLKQVFQGWKKRLGK